MKNNQENNIGLANLQTLNAQGSLISLTKNYGGTGCVEAGEPRETTIEIYYKEDSNKREWFVKRSHQYIEIEPNCYKETLKIKETLEKLDESYIQTICQKLESMNLEKYKHIHVLNSIPERYLAKWHIHYKGDVYMSYTDGYEPELVKELQELLGYELTEMYFMNNVYAEIKNPSAKQYYGQRFGLIDSKNKKLAKM